MGYGKIGLCESGGLDFVYRPLGRLPGMPQFVPLAERIVDALLASDPSLASFAGDHRFDDRLPDLSPAAVGSRGTTLRDGADALSRLDTDDRGRPPVRRAPARLARRDAGAWFAAAALPTHPAGHLNRRRPARSRSRSLGRPRAHFSA